MAKMIKAFVLGKVNPNSEKKVLEQCRKISGVKEAEATMGQYDFVVKVEANDENHLRDIIIGDLRKIPDISSTLTLISQKII